MYLYVYQNRKDMSNVNEIWVLAYDYEKYYEVSNTGKIRKLSTKRELVGHISKHGYRRVSLSKNNKNVNVSVHKIVIQSFLGDKKGFVVNHKNGIKLDNNINNLEWCTISENTLHSYKNGLQVNKKGIESIFAKLWVHKEYGLFLTTKELYKLYNTNGVNKKPMSYIRSQYDKINL